MFPDGRRIVSCSTEKEYLGKDSDDDSEYEYEGEIKVWDVVTGECVATLRGHSGSVRCGVHCTFVLTCVRCRSIVLPYLRTGGALFLGRTTRRSRCGTWRPANAWRRWKGTRAPCVAASAVLL